MSVSLEMSSTLLAGLVPRILWDVFRSCGRRTSSMCGERVQPLQSQNYSNSRVLGHGTQFVLGHTRSTRNLLIIILDTKRLDRLVSGHEVTRLPSREDSEVRFTVM